MTASGSTKLGSCLFFLFFGLSLGYASSEDVVINLNFNGLLPAKEILPPGPTPTPAPLVARDFDYLDENGTVFEGYIAYTDDGKQKPGILISPDWNSVSAHEKAKAIQFAELGFVAFAMDPYGKGIRPQSTAERAGNSSRLSTNRALTRLIALNALEVLKNHSNVNQDKIANVGYCLGGMIALELLRSGEAGNITATFVFHGNPNTPNKEDNKNLTGVILIQNAGRDTGIPVSTVTDFSESAYSYGIDNYYVIYSDAVHGFTVSDNPTAYNEKADKRSFAEVINLLEELEFIKK